jgi:error-prone DNA polymerase
MWQVANLNKAQFIRTPKGKRPTQEGRPLLLFEDYDEPVSLPDMTLSEHVVQDYATTAFSLKAHPLSFLRANFQQFNAKSATEHRNLQNGQRITVAGLVLVRQRPGTAKGTCFITLEDETGFINLIVWASIFDKYRDQILGAKLLMAEGNLQIAHGVVHVIVQHCHNIDFLLSLLTPDQQEDLIRLTLSRADEKDGTRFPDDLKNAKPFPEGRNFK